MHPHSLRRVIMKVLAQAPSLSRAVRAASATLVLSGSVVGCHDLTGNQALPAGTQDPSYYNNATGAIGMRNAAVFAFGVALPDYIAKTALLTDELTDISTLTATSGSAIANGGVITDPVDERLLPELSYGSSASYITDATYNKLQGVRTTLSQAIGQLATYDTSAKDAAILNPAVGRVMLGELYALYGYTEIQLADLFCSGIPLSTLDFQHDFTYRAGDSTAQVYRDAIAKFDTALVLSADSVRIQNLVRIGLGRAYLDLGSIVAAADDVSTVPDQFQYQMSEIWQYSADVNVINQVGTVANREGINGLPYLSSNDPRTADTTISIFYSSNSVQVGFPRLYASGLAQGGGYYAPVTIASGVEARLIQAEAALRSGNVTVWLNTLNALRTNGMMVDTVGVSGLALLTDPGTDSGRVALTFRERAAWLYMTGHRQGDLRRELRQYAQYWPDQSRLYPTGAYLGLGAGVYGTDVTAPIPSAEYINPLFHGCLNRAP